MRSWPLASVDGGTFAAAVNDLLTTAEKWKTVVDGMGDAQIAHEDQVEEEREILQSAPGGDCSFMRV